MTSRWRWISAVSVLALACSLLMLSAFALTVNLARLRESFSWVQHTNDVLLQLAGIEGDLVEAESVERGFLLNGDEDYRHTFQQLQASLPGRLDTLSDLVEDNPQQRKRAEQLRSGVGARLDELRQVVLLGPTQPEAALAAVRAAKLRRLTALAREELAAFRQTELDLLRAREVRADLDTTWGTWLAAATMVLALVGATFGLLLFQRARTVHRERELRTELIHVSRMNMMGQMASMLAHELNQPLAATGNYLRAMRRMVEAKQPPQPSVMVDALQRSAAQMDRARDIVQRLRSFIAKGEPAKAVEEVEPILDEAVALLGMQRGAWTVSREVAPDLPAVLVDKIQVEQVLINLMRNAIEAMEQSSRRLLGLSARRSEENMVLVSVSDTGSGLARHVADRLFQPFVSTKSGGMGVGLSICQTIVHANGGRIWAVPNPDGGTVFHFTLPIAPR